MTLDCDVSNIKDVQQMVKRAHNAMGRIDILVNNAGAITRKPAIEVTEEEWDSVVNTIGPGYYKTQQTALLFADKAWTEKTLARIPQGGLAYLKIWLELWCFWLPMLQIITLLVK